MLFMRELILHDEKVLIINFTAIKKIEIGT
jgi:hypothetical protein